jgi:membrane fusion protein, multidrug efflux system
MNESIASESPRQAKLNRRMVLLVGVPVTVLLVAAVVWLWGGRYISTDNAYVVAQKVIVTPSVAGRILSVDVKEGQHVKPGDVLFRIDPSTYELNLKQADAHLAQTVTSFESLRLSLQSLDRQIELVRQTLDLRQADSDRKVELLASKATSRNDVETAALSVVAAKTSLETLEQQKEAISVQLQGNPNLALNDFAPYREAKAARDKAKTDLDSTIIRASMDGIATQVPSIQLGRYIVPGTAILVIVDQDHPWIIANPKETDLTYVREGQSVSISVDAYPNRTWHGTVASLSPGTGAEFAVLPAQNASGNWVKVVQRVPVRIEFEAGSTVADLKSGMSAQVEIDSGHKRSMASIFGFSASASE